MSLPTGPGTVALLEDAITDATVGLVRSELPFGQDVLDALDVLARTPSPANIAAVRAAHAREAAPPTV